MVIRLFLPAVISNCTGGKGEEYFSLCEPHHGSTIFYVFSLVHFGGKSLPFSTIALFSYHKRKGDILGIFC